MTQQRRTVALAKGLVAVVVWGASFIATKVALAEAAPVAVVWARFAIGLVVLALVTAARREATTVPPARLLVLALLGLQGVTFHQWLQSMALVTSEASTSGWLVASAPVFIVLLAALFLGERLTPWQVAGIVVASVGVLEVVTRGDLAALVSRGLPVPSDLAMLLSAGNWAVFSVLSRRLLAGQPATRTLLVVMLAGWLGTSALAVAGDGLGQLGHVSLKGWAALAFLGVFCSGLAYILWYDALAGAPAAVVGALLYLEPLVAQIVATLLLGEQLRPATLLGGTGVLLGVWLVNRSPGNR